MVQSHDNPIASGVGPRPEFDEVLEGGMGVISAINRFRDESEMARRTRIWRNDQNWELYLGRQDFSHKKRGQSREFLPKVPVSVEQLTALVKRGMVQFGDYFSVEVGEELSDLVRGSDLRSIVKAFMDDLWSPGNVPTNFATQISDAVKQGLLKSLIILKIHGAPMKHRRFMYDRENDEVTTEEYERWHPRVDVVRPEDYYPDPTGNGLYEIQRVEKDLHEIIALSEGDDPIYDPNAVRQLIGMDFMRPEDEKLSERDRNQDETVHPSFRKRVVVDEFWGTLLNHDGTIAHRNVVATVANERFLIRPPEPNPFWHQESPFIAVPLIRVPHSVWHKALYDHASDLNKAINELYNLIIDGAISSVWGIKQIRTEDLENPADVEGGIYQGMTLSVKQTLPHGQKVLETVSEGQVPGEAMNVFESLNREFTGAAMTNELKLGALPAKQVLATEVLESSQSQNLMLDGIIADLELNVMARAIRMMMLNVLQNADHVPESAITNAASRRIASIIMRASPAERFAMFADHFKVKVYGLSATMTRALDFQKIMALLQSTSTNPLLMQAFMTRFSANKTLDRMMTTLNLNPDTLLKTPEEQAESAKEVQATQGAAALLGGGPQNAEGQPAGVAAGPGTGGNPQTAAVQQNAHPTSGLVPNS